MRSIAISVAAILFAATAAHAQQQIRPTQIQGVSSNTNNGTGGLVLKIAPTLTGPVVINNNAAALPTAPSGTTLQIGNANGSTTSLALDAFAASPQLVGRRAQGTAAAPTAVQTNQALLNIGGGGYRATGYTTAATLIQATAAENWTDTATGSAINFQTTPNGSTTRATVLTLGNDAKASFAGKGAFNGTGTNYQMDIGTGSSIGAYSAQSTRTNGFNALIFSDANPGTANYGGVAVTSTLDNWALGYTPSGGTQITPVITWNTAGASITGTVKASSLTTTGAATGKKVVCVDTATGQLYASSTGTDCSN